jgi:2-hydroxy-3-keto-5-methylthiopentenyl-1-phosphate phosphatase
VLRTLLPYHVLIDFDATVASVDTTDALLERFASPHWRTIEADWTAGRIGARECLAQQVALIRATPAELDAFSATLTVEPGIAEFVGVCQARRIELSVVSDGLDRTVSGVLAAHGLDVTVRANGLYYLGDSRWSVDFPYTHPTCTSLSGNFRCSTPDRDPGSLRVVVGDGGSDFCVAARPDVVFAKGALAQHLQGSSVPYATFGTFAEASRNLVEWLDGALAVQRPPDHAVPPGRGCAQH